MGGRGGALSLGHILGSSDFVLRWQADTETAGTDTLLSDVDSESGPFCILPQGLLLLRATRAAFLLLNTDLCRSVLSSNCPSSHRQMALSSSVRGLHTSFVTFPRLLLLPSESVFLPGPASQLAPPMNRRPETEGGPAPQSHLREPGCRTKEGRYPLSVLVSRLPSLSTGLSPFLRKRLRAGCRAWRKNNYCPSLLPYVLHSLGCLCVGVYFLLAMFNVVFPKPSPN